MTKPKTSIRAKNNDCLGDIRDGSMDIGNQSKESWDSSKDVKGAELTLKAWRTAMQAIRTQEYCMKQSSRPIMD